MDRWIISKLNSLIIEVDNYYKDFEPTKAARAISNFVINNLSNWYVRLNRRRFWKGEYGEDKISAFQTLFSVIIDICKMSSPISPFFTDKLYIDLTKNVYFKNKKISIHLESFPVADPQKINRKLEEKINFAQNISSLVLSLRAKQKIKVRQPLNKIIIPVNNDKEKSIINSISNELKAEVNVKNIEFMMGESDLLIKSIKPNFKKLGPKYGKQMKEISKTVNLLDNEEIMKFEKTKKIDLIIDKKTITFELDDFEISSKDIEGLIVANDGKLTVALDVNITEELQLEGIAREFVSNIQSLRKEIELDVTDRINFSYFSDVQLKEAIEKNLEYIKRETLTQRIEFKDDLKEFIEIKINNSIIKINITKV